MNIRELWDTVVLRDILGYMFPGAVTLLALALLITGLGWTTPHKLIGELAKFLDLKVLSENHWLPWHPWLLAAVLLPLSYVTGHVQIRIIQHFEERQPWNLGSLALQFLTDDQRGLDYCRAGLSVVGPKQEGNFEEEDLMSWIRQAKDKAENDRQKALKKKSEEERKQEEERHRQKEARDLWRLCDRYVLNEAPHAHTMFMGRYYILAVLFSNLGISTITLGLVLMALLRPAWQIPGLSVILALVLLGPISMTGFTLFSVVAQTGPYFLPALTILYVLTLAGLGVGALVSISQQIPALVAAVSLVGFGVVLIHRSSYFRKRFVQCTFPIFYALTQGEHPKTVPDG